MNFQNNKSLKKKAKSRNNFIIFTAVLINSLCVTILRTQMIIINSFLEAVYLCKSTKIGQWSECIASFKIKALFNFGSRFLVIK